MSIENGLAKPWRVWMQMGTNVVRRAGARRHHDSSGDAENLSGCRPRAVPDQEAHRKWLSKCQVKQGDVAGAGFRANWGEIAHKLDLPSSCMCTAVVPESVAIAASSAEFRAEARCADELKSTLWYCILQTTYVRKWLSRPSGRPSS